MAANGIQWMRTHRLCEHRVLEGIIRTFQHGHRCHENPMAEKESKESTRHWRVPRDKQGSSAQVEAVISEASRVEGNGINIDICTSCQSARQQQNRAEVCQDLGASR